MNVEFGKRDAEMDASAWLISIFSTFRIPTSEFQKPSTLYPKPYNLEIKHPERTSSIRIPLDIQHPIT